MRGLLAAYRRSGADLPFADPAGAHPTPFEGYYWRLVDPAARVVVVVLCGVCRPAEGTWATVAIAAHPGGFARHAEVEPALTEVGRLGVRAGSVLSGTASRLTARLGDDAWVDVRLRCRVAGPRGAWGTLGLAHALPGLDQYWHPVVLSAAVEGEARIGGRRLRLDGARGYVEKNWGPAFPQRWWWGHADAFPGGDVTVAFAGGPVRLGPRTLALTGAVVRLGTRVIRLIPPAALVRASAGEGRWRVEARSPRHLLRLEGTGGRPHLLPVPDVGERQVRMRSAQELAGRLAVELRRGRWTLLRAESPLAGLELGRPEPFAAHAGARGPGGASG
jgi:hypothetical protein